MSLFTSPVISRPPTVTVEVLPEEYRPTMDTEFAPVILPAVIDDVDVSASSLRPDNHDDEYTGLMTP